MSLDKRPMKVLFEFSREGLAEFSSAFEEIRKAILFHGDILTNDLLSDTKRLGVILPKKIFELLNKAIEDADCIVIEGSTVSLSLGYVLTQAIKFGKPVLYLYAEKTNENRVRFVKSIEYNLLKVKEYQSIDQLNRIIADYFYQNKYIKTRFNLVLPGDLNSYITVQSRKNKVSKTGYLINLIKDDRQKRIN